jgi:hypothetical protein
MPVCRLGEGIGRHVKPLALWRVGASPSHSNNPDSLRCTSLGAWAQLLDRTDSPRQCAGAACGAGLSGVGAAGLRTEAVAGADRAAGAGGSEFL